MRVTPYIQLAKNADMSTTVTSNTQQVYMQFGYAVQADYTTSGTLAGVLKLQASVDHEV